MLIAQSVNHIAQRLSFLALVSLGAAKVRPKSKHSVFLYFTTSVQWYGFTNSYEVIGLNPQTKTIGGVRKSIQS